MNHFEKPEENNLPSEDLDKIVSNIQNGNYYKYVKKLEPIIKDRIVISTISGKTGYALILDNNSWVIIYLENCCLLWSVGNGIIDDFNKKYLNAVDFADASSPISIDLPYSNQNCDIESEIKNAENKKITGIAYGENDFNICFPNGMELETMVFKNTDGKFALRVFWEQW